MFDVCTNQSWFFGIFSANQSRDFRERISCENEILSYMQILAEVDMNTKMDEL